MSMPIQLRLSFSAAATAVPQPQNMIYTSGTTGRPKGVRRKLPTPEQQKGLDEQRRLRGGFRLGACGLGGSLGVLSALGPRVLRGERNEASLLIEDNGPGVPPEHEAEVRADRRRLHEIFTHTLEGLGIPAAAAVHIGDNLHMDIRGARDAGMTAVWLNRRGGDPVEGVDPHHEVPTLEAFVELLA